MTRACGFVSDDVAKDRLDGIFEKPKEVEKSQEKLRESGEFWKGECMRQKIQLNLKLNLMDLRKNEKLSEYMRRKNTTQLEMVQRK